MEDTELLIDALREIAKATRYDLIDDVDYSTPEANVAKRALKQYFGDEYEKNSK